MVPPLRYVGNMEGTEQAVRHRQPVYQGGRGEAEAVGGRGDEGERGKILSGLREAYPYSHTLQVLGAGHDDIRQLLAGVIRETLEGAEDMGPYNRDTGKGGSQHKGVGDVLKCGCAGSISIRFGDVGDDPSHGPGPGGVPTQGSQPDHWEKI